MGGLGEVGGSEVGKMVCRGGLYEGRQKMAKQNAYHPQVDADGHIGLADAVEYLMRETGRTRRQAKQAILQALKAGTVRARGEVVLEDAATGERYELGDQDLGPEVFENIPSEH